jgi:hypothetical protein
MLGLFVLGLVGTVFFGVAFWFIPCSQGGPHKLISTRSPRPFHTMVKCEHCDKVNREEPINLLFF